MSTRCQILVENASTVVYRHFDGYPEGECGVLATLVPFVQEFTKSRGHDPNYLTAQIIAKFVKDYWEHCEKQGFPDYRFVGYGVEAWNGRFHSDIEFVYLVKKDHIEVLIPLEGFWDNPTLKNTRCSQKISL